MPAVKEKPEALDATMAAPDADIHHMVRTLAQFDMENGAIGPDTADAHLRTWLEKGYHLHTVVSLGNGDVNGAFVTRLLYILVR